MTNEIDQKPCALDCNYYALPDSRFCATHQGTPDYYALNDFTKAYIECALWSTHVDYSDDAEHGDDSFMQANYDGTDIAPETLAKMAEDCEDFQQENRALFQAYDKCGWYGDAQAGHDFWLTRNGHGAGFWDRGLGSIGDELSEIARPYGTFDLYLGDDGQIHH